MNRKLSKAEEGRYARAADWAESLDGLPPAAAVIDATINQEGRKLMEDLYGSSESVDRAMGRPGVDGRMTRGCSPVRQVRLPRELDALLAERAEQEHRRPNEIMRDALDQYLRKAS